jgi:cell division protein FtsQ
MSADAMTMDGFRAANFNFKPLLTGVSTLLLMLGAGGLYAAMQGNRMVAHLQVEGPFKHIQPEMVRAAVATQLTDGFLAMNLDAARASVEQLPWVEQARVERVWPGDLRIHVWEREPFSRWGEKGLLSTEAIAFTPATKEIPEGLPQLSGPPGHEKEVMDAYKQLSQRLAATPLPLVRLNMDMRGEWIAYSASGIELRLGQGQPESKLDTITGPMLHALGPRLAEVNYVDLRYTNGFAVAWRAPVAAAEEKK